MQCCLQSSQQVTVQLRMHIGLEPVADPIEYLLWSAWMCCAAHHKGCKPPTRRAMNSRSLAKYGRMMIVAQESIITGVGDTDLHSLSPLAGPARIPAFRLDMQRYAPLCMR